MQQLELAAALGKYTSPRLAAEWVRKVHHNFKIGKHVHSILDGAPICRNQIDVEVVDVEYGGFSDPLTLLVVTVDDVRYLLA